MIYILFLICTLIVLCFALYQVQHFMIFIPKYYREDGICPLCQYLSIVTPENIELEGVVYEPKDPKATLLFFGGRSDDSVALINKLSQNYPTYRVVTFNYRSFGKSAGSASEKNILQDGVYIAHIIEKNYGAFHLLGFSLGSSVATYIAAHHKVQNLFLVGAFSSIEDLIKQKYKLPRVCIRYRFNTKKYIQNVSAPVVFFGSHADTITPVDGLQELYAMSKNPKGYYIFDTPSHKELLCYSKIVTQIHKVIDETSV